MIIAMSSRALIALVILFAYSALTAYSIPIPPELALHVTDPTATPEQLKIMQDVQHSTNARLHDMSEVVNNPHDRGNRRILIKSFGKNHNLKAIQEGVAKLRSSTIVVKSVNEDPKSVRTAATSRPDNTLKFSDKYFSSKNPSERTATMIHEAAHAVLNAHDFFENNPDPKKIKPISRGRALKLTKDAEKDGKPVDHYVLSGYIQKDFNLIKEKVPHLTHHSSDSWRALSHYSSKGINTPLDMDRPHRPSYIDNKGVSDTSTATQPPSSHGGKTQAPRPQNGGALVNHGGQSSRQNHNAPRRPPVAQKGVPNQKPLTQAAPPLLSPEPHRGRLPNRQTMRDDRRTPTKRPKAGSGSPHRVSPNSSPDRGRSISTSRATAGSPSPHRVSPNSSPNRGRSISTSRATAGSSSPHRVSPNSSPHRGRSISTSRATAGSPSPHRVSPNSSPNRGRSISTSRATAGSPSRHRVGPSRSTSPKPTHPRTEHPNVKTPVLTSPARKIAAPLKQKPGPKK